VVPESHHAARASSVGFPHAGAQLWRGPRPTPSPSPSPWPRCGLIRSAVLWAAYPDGTSQSTTHARGHEAVENFPCQRSFMQLCRNRKPGHRGGTLKGHVECAVVDCMHPASQAPRPRSDRRSPTTCALLPHSLSIRGTWRSPLRNATTSRFCRILLQPLHLQVGVTCMMPSRPRNRLRPKLPPSSNRPPRTANIQVRSNLTGASEYAQLNAAEVVLALAV